MTLDLGQLNWLAVIVAAVVYFALGALCVMAVAVAMLAAATGTDELGEGIVFGLVLAIGLSLAHTFVDASFSPEKPQPWTWFAINGTYHAIGLVIVAVIIAIWP